MASLSLSTIILCVIILAFGLALVKVVRAIVSGSGESRVS
jgi:hypothetical protein